MNNEVIMTLLAGAAFGAAVLPSSIVGDFVGRRLSLGGAVYVVVSLTVWAACMGLVILAIKYLDFIFPPGEVIRANSIFWGGGFAIGLLTCHIAPRITQALRSRNQ